MNLSEFFEKNQWAIDVISTVVFPISLGVTFLSPNIQGELYIKLWNHLWWFCCFSAFVSAGTLIIVKRWQYKYIDTVSGLKQELESCKELFDPAIILDIFTGYLYALSSVQLKFGSGIQNCERITLYIHDLNSSFIPFSRVSQNPIFKKKGRLSYPDNVGCIGKAWANSWHFDNSFPPENGEYAKYSKKHYGMNNSEITSLSMRSMLFACMRIEGDDRPLGIIVVESTRPDRFTEDEIKELLNSQQCYISNMLKKWHHLIPKIENARAVGV